MDVVNLPALLADAVRGHAPSEPLDRIEAALAVSEELASSADKVIGQFVAEARAAGCSWTEIGQRIGVSKQAAGQRFVRPGSGQHDPGLPQPRRRLSRRRKAGESRCSFCGKAATAMLRLIAGPGVYICVECVCMCNEILAEEGWEA